MHSSNSSSSSSNTTQRDRYDYSYECANASTFTSKKSPGSSSFPTPRPQIIEAQQPSTPRNGLALQLCQPVQSLSAAVSQPRAVWARKPF